MIFKCRMVFIIAIILGLRAVFEGSLALSLSSENSGRLSTGISKSQTVLLNFTQLVEVIRPLVFFSSTILCVEKKDPTSLNPWKQKAD